eukprot:150008_1
MNRLCADNQEELASDDICPCNPKKQITYGSCCKPRQLLTWHKDNETGEIYRSVIIKDRGVLSLMSHYTQIRDQIHGHNPNDAFFLNQNGSPVTLDQYNDMKRDVFTMFLQLKLIDPCHFYCIIHADFFPIYWRYRLIRKEQKIRKKEWNHCVRKYIKTRHVSEHHEVRMDRRSPEKIKLLFKIGVNGTLQRQECLQCHRRETVEFEYKVCQNCKVAKYCSKHCQKRHWAIHKTACQNNSVKAQSVGGDTMEQILKNICHI